MSDRDELFDTARSVIDGELGILVNGSDIDNTADSLSYAILAAGYRRPRIITTAEELGALPAGSVILDPVGLSLHKNEFTGWRASNGAKDIPADMLASEALPATVLHEPEPTK